MSNFGRKWWVFVVRGVLAVFFGLLCFTVPGMSLAFLIALVGAFWLLDGITALFATERAAKEHRPWGWLTFEGVFSVLAAVVTWRYPDLTALALLSLIAWWAIIIGVLKLATAIRLRKVIENEWMAVASGLLSIAFGVVLIARPGAGALALVWFIGAYAVVFGALLIGMGFRLHGLSDDRTVAA